MTAPQLPGEVIRSTAGSPWGRDAERYREGLRLTGAEVPNRVLAHLDRVWPYRQKVDHSGTLHVAAWESSDAVGRMERAVREEFALGLAREGLGLVSVRPLWWTQHRWPGGSGADPSSVPSESGWPWKPGTQTVEDAHLLVCRMSGVAVPVLTEGA